MKKVEIEIDEKLFGDWKPVAFRVPKDGEYYAQVSEYNKNMTALKADGFEFGRLIIEKKRGKK